MRIFEVVADPTRRRILELLAERDRMAGELAEEFALSQPAVSKHLRVLRDAGAVSSRPDGNRRIYQLEPEALQALDDWVRARRRAWEARLDALEAHLVHRTRRRRRA